MTKQKISESLSNIKDELGQSSVFQKKSLLADLIKDQLIKLIGSTPEIEGLEMHMTFFDLGMDSLVAIQFKVLLEKKLGIILSPKTIYQHNTTKALVEYLIEQIQPK